MSEMELEKYKNTNIMLISSIVFGAMFQFLFYDNNPGVSIPVFIAVFYAAFFISLRNLLKRMGLFEYILILLTALLSMTYVFYADPIFMFFNIFFIAVMIAAQTLLFSESNLHTWYEAGFAADLLQAFFYRPFAFFLKPFLYIGERMNVKLKDSKYKTLTRVIAGLCIAVPILIVVISLLSSADMIFDSFLGNLNDFFRNINLGDLLPRFILGVSAALLLFSYLWSIFVKKHNKENEKGETENKKAAGITGRVGMDPVISITVLTAVNIVYLLFTFIQFTYLFGSLNLQLPSAYTYAEYARRGFFELVIVTVINLCILLGALNFTKNAGKISGKCMKVLNTVLVVCTLVMLFSAHFRMAMYENAYGYTYLRLLTHAFMVFILVLLITALIKVWHSRLILMKCYVITAVAAYTLINFMNVNAIIAKNNIDRYHRTGKIDVYYLTSLSTDAVPYTSKFYDELKDKDKGNAEVLKEHLQNQQDMLKGDDSWQSFNFSRSRAKKILNTMYPGDKTNK